MGGTGSVLLTQFKPRNVRFTNEKNAKNIDITFLKIVPISDCGIESVTIQMWRKIPLGDETGDGTVMLRPIRFHCVGGGISLPCVHVHQYAEGLPCRPNV